MHRKVPLTQQVYTLLYPTISAAKPDANQPPNFESLARHHLAKEARHEARTFYGEDGGLLLRLAGFDYNLPHVRRRLSRCRHHRRLFIAFDQLCLTPHEIYELCTWDCTLWQRNKFLERHPEQALAVEDTTGCEVPTWEEVEARRERQREHDRMTSRIEGLMSHDRVVGRIAQYLDVDERLLTPRAASTVGTEDVTSRHEDEHRRQHIDTREVHDAEDGSDIDKNENEDDGVDDELLHPDPEGGTEARAVVRAPLIEAAEDSEHDTDGEEKVEPDEDEPDAERDAYSAAPPELDAHYNPTTASAARYHPSRSSQGSIDTAHARVLQISSALVQG